MDLSLDAYVVFLVFSSISGSRFGLSPGVKLELRFLGGDTYSSFACCDFIRGGWFFFWLAWRSSLGGRVGEKGVLEPWFVLKHMYCGFVQSGGVCILGNG